ncbi:hypothetical protein [Undibacterium sp. Di24W]|uniref:hypothetical protein n=1 Tax=Undibacterium sp. Di24W TaxID=3413033 RepID=UPI003BEFF386
MKTILSVFALVLFGVGGIWAGAVAGIGTEYVVYMGPLDRPDIYKVFGIKLPSYFAKLPAPNRPDTRLTQLAVEQLHRSSVGLAELGEPVRVIEASGSIGSPKLTKANYLVTVVGTKGRAFLLAEAIKEGNVWKLEGTVRLRLLPSEREIRLEN